MMILRPSVQRALAAAVATLIVGSVAMAQPTVTAPALKAAFLYNFATLAEWPADERAIGPLTICVLGDNTIADALEAAAKGRPIGGRTVVVARVKAEELLPCQVLYLTGLDSNRSRQIIDALKNAPILTVSDRDRFAESGGIAGLFVEDGKMRFAINVEAAKRVRLRLSSKLLSLAKLVKDEHVHP